MQEIKTYKELKEKAIKWEGKLLVYDSYFKKELSYEPKFFQNNENKYNICNNIIVFQENKCCYFIPWNSNYARIIAIQNFEKSSILDIPKFSEKLYPIKERNKWFELLEEEEYFEEFQSQIFKSISGTLKTKNVPEKLIKKSLIVSQLGILLDVGLDIKTYYPVIKNSYFDPVILRKIGIFSEKFGICVYVNEEGKTYITKNEEVIKWIAENYQESNIEIPEISTDTIIDVEIRELWNNL